MTQLEETSLTATERLVLARLVAELRREYGDRLVAVWLYGSRARGEPPRHESDVDLLVILRDATYDDDMRIHLLAVELAGAEGTSPVFFSPLVYTPERLAQRREIRSFFIQEVDRDKVVLAGEP